MSVLKNMLQPALRSVLKSALDIPFTPFDIAGLIGWNTTYDPSTITYNESNLVSAWANLNEASSFTQGTTELKPTYSAPFLTFDGTSDYMQDDTVPPSIANWTSARTYIVNVEVATTPVGSLFEIEATSSNFRDERIFFNASNQISFISNHGDDDVELTGSQPSAGMHTFFVTVKSNTDNRVPTLYQDNTSLATATSMGAGSIVPNSLTIGAKADGGGYLIPANFTNCSMKDIMLFNKTLDTTERANITAFFRSRD